MKIRITEDGDHRTKIKAALEANEGFCPCCIERSPDTKCMCKDFREQAVEGPCHCGLYIKYKE